MADLAVLNLQIVNQQANQAAKQTTRVLERMDLSAQNVGRSVRNLGLKMTAAVTLPLVLAGRAAVKAASQFEKGRVAFGVFLGDAEKGIATFDKLIAFSARTPLNIGALQNASQMLLAMNATGGDLFKTLEVLGNAARADGNILARLSLALGQVASAGKLTGLSLKRFYTAGVNLNEELAKAFGKTQEQMRKMISAGKIGFEDVRNALIRMSAEGGRFNKLMEKMAQTLGGKWTTAVDNVRIALASFVDPFREQLKRALDFIIRISQAAARITPEFKKLIVTVLAVAAAIGPILTILGTMIIAAGALKASLAVLGIVLVPALVTLGKVLVVVGLITATVEGLRRAFGVTWKEIGQGALNFVKTFIGFIVNIRANLTLLSAWLGRNWQNLLVDMLKASIIFSQNLWTNIKVGLNLISRAFGVLTSWIADNWENALVVISDKMVAFADSMISLAGKLGLEFVKAVVKGMLREKVKIDLFGEFVKGAAQAGTLAERFEKAFKDGAKGFVPFLQGFKRTTEQLPNFLTDFKVFSDNLKKTVERAPDGDPGDGTAEGASTKLADALQAGTAEAFKLLGSSSGQDRAVRQQKKIEQNTRDTKEGIDSMLNIGVPIRGLKVVDNVALA